VTGVRAPGDRLAQRRTAVLAPRGNVTRLRIDDRPGWESGPASEAGISETFGHPNAASAQAGNSGHASVLMVRRRQRFASQLSWVLPDNCGYQSTVGSLAVLHLRQHQPASFRGYPATVADERVRTRSFRSRLRGCLSHGTCRMPGQRFMGAQIGYSFHVSCCRSSEAAYYAGACATVVADSAWLRTVGLWIWPRPRGPAG
jgi:hypothetical protein